VLQAGGNQTLSVTFTPADQSFQPFAAATAINVFQAPLVITAGNRTKMFGQTVTFAGTEFAAKGLLNSDTVTSVALASSGAAAGATVAGSPYSIVPSAAAGSGLGNYAISYVNGILTVATPLMSFVSNHPNMLLSWPTNACAFVLNRTASLAPPVRWTLVTSGIAVNGTNYTITINTTGGNEFYQLFAPPAAPLLDFVFNRPNMLLSWPTNSGVYVLNRTASLAPPVIWTPLNSGITVNGTNYTISINTSGGTQFYQLIAP
jgi:hypothetical protein